MRPPPCCSTIRRPRHSSGAALRNTELRQQGNDGRLYDKAFAEKAHDVQDPMIMREITVSAIGDAYALHRLFGPGPEPTPEEELERRLRGVRVFPHAGFVHHRHARGQTSLSWRNSIMALPLTREGIYTIAPAGNTWLGMPAVEGPTGQPPPGERHVEPIDQGFAAALIVDRCQESLRQEVLLASLPDGRMLSWERFVALEDLVLQSLQQGWLRITNETFPRLGANSRGVRTLYHPGGAKDYRGGLGDSPDERRHRPVLIGRRGSTSTTGSGLRFIGPGETVYHNRHYHRPYHAIADDLVLSRLEGKRPLRAASPPSRWRRSWCRRRTTPTRPRRTYVSSSGPAHAACLAADDGLAAANFASEQCHCAFHARATGSGRQPTLGRASRRRARISACRSCCTAAVRGS